MENPIATVIFNGERVNVFFLRQKTRERCLLSPPPFPLHGRSLPVTGKKKKQLSHMTTYIRNTLKIYPQRLLELMGKSCPHTRAIYKNHWISGYSWKTIANEILKQTIYNSPPPKKTENMDKLNKRCVRPLPQKLHNWKVIRKWRDILPLWIRRLNTINKNVSFSQKKLWMYCYLLILSDSKIYM